MSDRPVRRTIPAGMTEIAPGACVGVNVREVEGIAHAEITGHFTRRRVESDAVFRAMRAVDAAWRQYLKRTAGRK